MDNVIAVLMWFSGWWYFSTLRKRIEELESQVSSMVQDKQTTNEL